MGKRVIGIDDLVATLTSFEHGLITRDSILDLCDSVRISDASLARWAARVGAWHAGGEPDDLPRGAVRIGAPAARRPGGRDVYCYFDNTDVKLRAPVDATRLVRLLGARSV